METMPYKYIEGLDRNGQHQVVSHLYAYRTNTSELDGPMCVRGWNRSDGAGYSIFRGNTSDKGTCKICSRRAAKGLGPVESRKRKTKWI